MDTTPFRISFLAHLLLLAGCSMRIAAKAPAPPALENAKSLVYAIEQGFPAYQADPISRYEQPEITNVEFDIEALMNETDQSLFVAEADLLKKDWEVLVALDNVMQREGVI